MLFSLNFVKCMVNFCKVFAAYKQVRDSTAFFFYQIAGILLLLSTTINFWYLSKVSVQTVGAIKWNMLNFMAIVYVLWSLIIVHNIDPLFLSSLIRIHSKCFDGKSILE